MEQERVSGDLCEWGVSTGSVRTICLRQIGSHRNGAPCGKQLWTVAAKHGIGWDSPALASLIDYGNKLHKIVCWY